ncbi:MAG: hypothetical protein QNK36_12950 [Colwellia sp.]|nr:hypothetical protein [Colwellia sp.]
MKNKLSIVLVLALFCGATKAEQICQTNEGVLGAHYRLVNSQVNTAKNELLKTDKTIKLSSLWRKNQKVLSVNGEQSTTWFKLNNGSVQKTAHFDHFKRSIEYQAKPMSDDRWQQIRQLIPDSKKQSLNFAGSQLKGCYQQESYQWENEKSNLQGKLLWNADLKLITELTIKQGNRQSHWKLEKIEQDEAIIEAAFSQRAKYQATDFADIGDNESDPFLIKMINLGFIEHGSSGIYNTQGENMAIEHNH